MRRQRRTYFLFAMCLALAGGSHAAAETKLRFNQNLPATHWAFARIVTPWIKAVEAATKGRVKIELTGASLGGFPQSVDLTGQGVVDAAFGNYGVLPGRFTLAKMTEIPFLGADRQLPISLAYWRAYHAHFAKAEEHEKAGVKAMAFWVSGSNHFFMRDKAVTKAADLKGMKFSVPSSTVERMLAKFGAVSIVTGTNDFYDQMSRGIVDGATLANTGPTAVRVDPFIKHQTSVPGSLYFSGFFIVMNSKKWDALPAEDKTAVWSVSGEALVTAAAKVFEEMEAVALEGRKKAGLVKMITADAAFVADMKREFAFVEQDWIAEAKKLGFDGAAALAALRAEAIKLDSAR